MSVASSLGILCAAGTDSSLYACVIALFNVAVDASLLPGSSSSKISHIRFPYRWHATPKSSTWRQSSFNV
eukprot:9477788-Pyramimonas_sp.AAC.1